MLTADTRGDDLHAAPAAPPKVLWEPAQNRRSTSVDQLIAWLGKHRGLHLADYESFLRWSIDEHTEFWSTLWDFFALPGERRVSGCVAL